MSRTIGDLIDEATEAAGDADGKKPIEPTGILIALAIDELGDTLAESMADVQDELKALRIAVEDLVTAARDRGR